MNNITGLKNSFLKRYDLWIIFAVTFAVFAFLKIHQFYSFTSINAEVIDWYETTVWNFLQGKFFIANHNIPLFSEHFSPFIIFLVPFYALFRSPYVFIVIHALACALPVIPLYLLAEKYFTYRFAPVAFCLAYFFSRIVNLGLMFDFHIEIFYPLLFLSALLYIEKVRWNLVYVFLILALMIKEDASIAVIAIGIYIFFSKEKQKGIIISLIGLTWLLLTTQVIIPYYRAGIYGWGYGFLSYWSEYGNTQKDIFLNMFNPVKHIQVLFTGAKMQSTFNFFSVYLFLPFFAPLAFLLLVLPQWFLLYSSGNTMMFNVVNYYGYLSLPFLFYTCILGFKNIEKKVHKKYFIISILILLVIVNAANSRYYKLFFQDSMKKKARYEVVEKIIENIPPQSSITAQANLVGHIPPGENRVFFPQNINESELILLDLEGAKWPLSDSDYKQCVDTLLNNINFRVIENNSSFLYIENLQVKK
ncbi:MAG: DUF2079 domain-containing protein [Ignavibacteriae bacterium]|nr:MAG: DUF2079 domain-containing protein [Ignavibacteriota bacterium]